MYRNGLTVAIRFGAPTCGDSRLFITLRHEISSESISLKRYTVHTKRMADVRVRRILESYSRLKRLIEYIENALVNLSFGDSIYH